MAGHRYSVGQLVYFNPSRSDRSSAVAGSYRVVRLLPEEQGNHQYRIKSMSDARERVAQESQLERRGTAFK
jgi:hypothetical protein